MNMRKLCASISVTAVTGAALTMAAVSPAAADPTFTPNALVPAQGTMDIVGVGSDTIEGVVADLANGKNVAGTPVAGFNAGKTDATGGRLASWDAMNAAHDATSSIVPRAGAASMTRPNGSGSGKKALYGAGNTPAINFARSSSSLNQAEKDAGLKQFAFAVDGLKIAVSGQIASNAPVSLTDLDVLHIFDGTYQTWNQVPGMPATATGVIKPYVPQAGSGTRGFFEGQLVAIRAAHGGSGSAWSITDYGAPNAANGYPGVKEAQEHNPTPIENDPNAIAPFSTARAHTLSNNTVIHLEDGWNARRAVYDVVRSSDAGAQWALDVFGPTGFFCSPAAKPIIEANGFAQLTSVANGGVCGNATQDAISNANLTTNTVQTTTTLAGASNAGGSASLSATVAGSGADGTVQFLEGNTVVGTSVLAAGTATKTVTNLTPGQHTFVAKFVPSNEASFSASQSAPTNVVVKSASVTTLTVPGATFGHASTAKVQVAVGSSAGTGSVTVKVGSFSKTVALVSGSASVVLPSTLPVGKPRVTASYAGSDTVASSSATAPLTISKSSVTASETFASVINKGARAKGTVTIALSPSSSVKPTGSVTIKRGTTIVGSGSLRSGSVTITLAKLPKGQNSLTIVYGGSANTKTVSKKFTITQR